MYLDFYDLKKAPFNITPDPEFLSLSRSNREAMASIIYGVENRKGFIVVTGEVGVGKTTIVRSYLERADKARLKIVYIFNSNITFKDLLKTIFRELDRKAEPNDVFEMVNSIHHLLIEEYRQGNNVVLIIDEAQNMPKETLENLRMLSNIETSTDKLIQVVLVGQPEFEQMLDLRELRQLKQRIALCSEISPMTEKESLAYIKYRLAKVAMSRAPLFTRGALKQIVREAKGIPRVLNILCDNALITGTGYRKRPVNARIAREVIGDFESEGVEERSPRLRYFFASVSVFLVTTGLIWFSPSTDCFSGLEKLVSRISGENTDRSKAEYAFSLGDSGELATRRTEEIAVRKEILPSPEKHFPRVRAAQKGDSLYELTKEVYGFTNPRLIAWIKEKNPNIKHAEKIQAGELILFPEIEETETHNARGIKKDGEG